MAASCVNRYVGLSQMCSIISGILVHQCRLQDHVDMESLPNAILLHILSYLDPQSLGRCSQVRQPPH